MGASQCKEACGGKAAEAPPSTSDEAVPIIDDTTIVSQAPAKQEEAPPPLQLAAAVEAAPAVKQGGEYIVTLEKANGVKLGLDVDTMAEEGALPVRAITGGLIEAWNAQNPAAQVLLGDKIIEVNGVRGDATTLVGKCANDPTLRMVLERA